jgi:cell division protease FtsH
MDETDRPSAPPPGSEPPRPPRSRVFWLPFALITALLFWLFAWGDRAMSKRTSGSTLDYSAFYAMVTEDKVARVTLRGREIEGELKEADKPFSTVAPEAEDKDLIPALRAHGVAIRAVEESPSMLGPLVVTILPWILVLGAWFWMSRRAQSMLTGGGAMGPLLRGRARRFEPQSHVRVRFGDVAGLAAAKRDLEEVVQFLREPERFRKLGGKLPRGVLLVGPPGTGKTLLARAVAGEAAVPFFYVNGSEFIQLFVGLGASRVRELFDEAKKASPAIVFIDELDAVGRARGAGIGGGNDEREQTLNQLLSEMDGFTRTDQTIVLAATNRPDVLDAALLRPGRFDRRIVVDRPERTARVAILKVHTREIPLTPDVSLEELASATPGFSGADLANLANEAALAAARRGAQAVAKADFSAAMDKITLGDPRETLLSPEERRRVAAHESGHAIVAWFTEDAEPLHRVSILPRGMSLGATQQLREQDHHLMTLPELEAKLRVLLGGYACEELLFGNVSSGSENDLREATGMAIQMVAHFGMSARLGPVFHEHQIEHPFLGQKLATDAGVSDATLHTIEEEARSLLGGASETARHTLEAHRAELTRVMNALLDKETLEKDDFARLVANGRTDEHAAAR